MKIYILYCYLIYLYVQQIEVVGTCKQHTRHAPISISALTFATSWPTSIFTLSQYSQTQLGKGIEMDETDTCADILHINLWAELAISGKSQN